MHVTIITYKVPNSTSLLMNSSNILVSTMGFSRAPWTSCPKIKNVKMTEIESGIRRESSVPQAN